MTTILFWVAVWFGVFVLGWFLNIVVKTLLSAYAEMLERNERGR